MTVKESQSRVVSVGEPNSARKIRGLETGVAVEVPFTVMRWYKPRDKGGMSLGPGSRPPERETKILLPALPPDVL